jgi:hypothetical protein
MRPPRERRDERRRAVSDERERDPAAGGSDGEGIPLPGEAGDGARLPSPEEAAAAEAMDALARVEAADAAARREAAPDLPPGAIAAPVLPPPDDRRVRESGVSRRWLAGVPLLALALHLASLVHVVEGRAGTGVSRLRGWPRGFWYHWVDAGGVDARSGPVLASFLANWVVWMAIVLAFAVAARLIRESSRNRPPRGVG